MLNTIIVIRIRLKGRSSRTISFTSGSLYGTPPAILLIKNKQTETPFTPKLQHGLTKADLLNTI